MSRDSSPSVPAVASENIFRSHFVIQKKTGEELGQMKKIVSLLAAGFVIMSMTGCGSAAAASAESEAVEEENVQPVTQESELPVRTKDGARLAEIKVRKASHWHFTGLCTVCISDGMKMELKSVQGLMSNLENILQKSLGWSLNSWRWISRNV